MSDTQSLTIRLPVAVLTKARIAAAKRGTSISALLAEKIEEIAGDDEGYDAAKRHAVRLLDRGFTSAAASCRVKACTSGEHIR